MWDEINEWKKERFLEHVGKGLSITSACKLAQVTRKSVYAWRKVDEDFAASWDEAEIAGLEYLEDEARRRAVDGCPNYLIHQGQTVKRVDPKTLETHEIIKLEYSDTLLMMLLKARDPARYCEGVRKANIEREWKLKEAERAANANTLPAADIVAMLAEIAKQKAVLVAEYEAVEEAKKAAAKQKTGNAA